METKSSNISVGIYDLITSLCQKFAQNPSRIKALRSHFYEILLRKTRPDVTKRFKILSIDDPICNLLAWQFVLSHHYKLSKYAEQINDYHEFIHNCCVNDNKQLDTYLSVLKFLLNLKNIPIVQDDPMDISLLPEWSPDPNFNDLFTLPDSIISQATNDLDCAFNFKSSHKRPPLKTIYSKPSCSCSSYSQQLGRRKLKEVEEELGVTFLQEESCDNIWEIAATEEYSCRKNWENYGYSEPDREPRFLTELGDLSSIWVDNLPSVYFSKIFKYGMVLRSEIKCKKNFIKDLKHLLVGMASESFSYNDFGELILIPGITLEGITDETLEVYSRDFTLSGTCYKTLYEISLPDPHTNKYKCAGYIFAELCENLGKYLQFYRTAIMSIPDCVDILDFSERTSHLRKQVATLAAICKVGPYKESEDMPHGVALLNYLYQKVSEVIDKKIILVLYSILFPCCQIYFGRFILQWIFDGSINDPYDEFFIKTNYKYISTRGRTYWTRSFIVRQDIIPDFLNELRESILLCGKMMNLLKLCHPFSQLCIYLMGNKPQFVSCCITKEQLMVLEQSAQTYYLETSEVCGSKFSLAFFLQKNQELDNELLHFISRKRAATLKRIGIERQKRTQEEYERKLEERAMLKEQYNMALYQKQFQVLQEIEREIKSTETSIEILKKRDILIQQESRDMVAYYEQLFEISDQRRMQIEKSISILKNYHLESCQKLQTQENHTAETNHNIISDEVQTNSVTIIPTINIGDTVQDQRGVSSQEIHSAKSLDELNANFEEPEERDESSNKDKKEDNGNNNLTRDRVSSNDNFTQTLKTFEIAKINRNKVMTETVGMSIGDVVTHKSTVSIGFNTNALTDAQKNKLRVMSSEFDIDIKPREIREKEITISDINKYRMMSSTVFSGENYVEKKQIDNENMLNKNIPGQIKSQKKIYEAPKEIFNINKAENVDSLPKIQKSCSLSLDLNFKTETKCLPMSVDSTPLSDITSIAITPPSKLFLGDDKTNSSSFPTTAGTEMTDDGCFKFNENYSIPESCNFQIEKPVFSKIFSSEDVKNIKPMCLQKFLSESLSYSLVVQSNLVSSELLRYFIVDLKCLEHLKNLKSYFFLQDGEFGKNVIDSLFQKLYNAKFPIELINFRVLSYIIHGAIEDTRRTDKFNNLSFKINSLPDSFNLGNIDVLSCLSLTYTVEWPLNILLPCDAIAKYNDVFKFLLKINRMNWVLKKMFMNLRMLAKGSGRKEQYLMVSVHYRKIHQFRHVMMHFVQTLQNYITGDVFQTSWTLFEKSLQTVTNLDELYDTHTHYLKNILFMCLLNQRSAPLKKVLDKIFTVILKFYDHLRSKKWECKKGTFVHPNFPKLETIFRNFSELISYLFIVGKKVVNNGYQPHFKHLLDSLNSNGFYSRNCVID